MVDDADRPRCLSRIAAVSEFQKNLGVAKNILSTRLRQMVANGILEMRPSADGGVRNEYHLTEKGRRLRLILVALRQWGEDNLFAEDELPSTIMVEEATGQPIGRLRLTAQDGRALESTISRCGSSSAWRIRSPRV